MKNNVLKTIVASVGIISICTVAFLLKSPYVLWSLLLLIFLIREVDIEL